MSKIKGQNIRIGVKTEGGTVKYFAASTSCSLNVNADVEDSSTKDDAVSGVAWRTQEVVGKNWDCSVEMQLVDADTAANIGLDVADMVGTEVDVEVNTVSGEQNRTKQSTLYTGKALITAWSGTFQNRQTGTASVSLQGQGALTKGE